MDISLLPSIMKYKQLGEHTFVDCRVLDCWHNYHKMRELSHGLTSSSLFHNNIRTSLSLLSSIMKF